MRRLLALLLVVFLLLGTCLAEGDSNIDGGGGDMGGGDGASAWNPGDEGVRVTILYETTPVSIIDYSNGFRNRIEFSFQKQCKLSYLNGSPLIPTFDEYNYIVPTIPLPQIISTNGNSNIEAIRQTFTTENRLRDLARDAGIDYDELTNGSYKLLLEPIAYFKYNGTQYAMTATEAALYDKKVGGDLRYRMGTLTHQNLPFSMFLERTDLGIPAWSGATSGRQTNETIINYLGVGIVSFRYTPDMEPEPPTGDYVYRTDTEVITSVLFHNTGGDLTPDSGASITFTILGNTYDKSFVCPSGGSQLVWVRWHTPETPQDITIEVSGPGTYTTLPVSIVKLPDKEPPNPIYDGPGVNAGQYQPGFRLEDLPEWGSQTSTTWREWYAIWHPEIIIPMPPPALPIIIPGYWSFSILEYGANLNVKYDLIPSAYNPTAFDLGMGKYQQKSGYGVQIKCESRVSGVGGVSNYDITVAQSGVAVFPDFSFKTYDRVLEADDPGHYHTFWRFRENPYSYHKERVHYVPVWYTASTYPVPLAIFDAWTPGGHLYASVSDYVEIKGDMYDDWYIRVIDG